jgi:ribose 5-phosphate isomerase A
LERLDLAPQLRQKDGQPFVTDNGNWILDCGLQPVADAESLDRAIRSIPGVVETGLFLGMVDAAIVQRGEQVEVLERQRV